MQEQPGASGAALPGVGVDREERAVDRLIEIRVGKDDVRTLAAKLQRHLLDRAGGDRHDPAAGLGFAGEGDLVDQRMRDQRLADLVARTRQTLTTPSGTPASRQISPRMIAVIGVVLAGLRTTVLPAASAGAELPGRHQQWEVPGHDLRANADRLAQRCNRAADRSSGSARPRCWVATIAVILEAVGRCGHVAPRFDDDLAAIHRFHARDLVDPLAQDRGDPVSARDRSSGVNRGQGPLSNAARAAATARSTSSRPAFGTRPITSLVVGLTVSNVSPMPPERSCHQSAGDIPAPPPPQSRPSIRIESLWMKDTLHFMTAQWYYPRAPPRAGVAKWQTHRTQNATRKLVRVRIPLPAPSVRNRYQ